MDFNFAHFGNFNFAHFELEESFWLIWVKLQNGQISLANFLFGYLKGAHFRYGLIFVHFVSKGSFGQI